MHIFDRFRCTTTTIRSGGLWLASFAVLLVAAVAVSAIVPVGAAVVNALVYAALGGACLFTYSRCRTAHCAVTGPGFLVMALALALHAAGLWRVSETFVWAALGATVGAGVLFEVVVARRGRRSAEAGSDQ